MVVQKQLYAYRRRSDSVVGYGFQIDAGNGRIHHSVAWPDRACERFSDAMLENQLILFEPVPAPVNHPSPVASQQLDSADATPNGVAPIGDTPPVQLAADPVVNQLGSASGGQQDQPHGGSPGSTESQLSQSSPSVDGSPGSQGTGIPRDPSPGSTSDQGQPVHPNFHLDSRDSDATNVKVLLRAFPAASNLDVIRAMHDRNIEVTNEFVQQQRIELASASS